MNEEQRKIFESLKKEEVEESVNSRVLLIDPAFSTVELSDMLAASRDRDVAEEGARRIRACEAKVAKLREHLAGAEAALAAEIAAQEGTN